MASFSAQEKSTISTLSALVTLRVSRYPAAEPSSVHGTRRSARPAALLSAELFSRSDSSIIETILS